MTVILSLNLYDPYATINHVNSLAFNRSTSSAGETEALLYIQNELSKEDIKSYVEHFSYIGARKVLMRLTYLIVFSYLIILRQFLIIALYFCIKYLSERLNFDVLFIWPGAEEWGLIGSDRFLKRHRHELEQVYDLNNSYCINIDMVGTYIGLFNKKGFFHKKKLNKRLNDDLENSAYKLGIPIVKYNSFRIPKSDHRSFIKLAKKTKTSLEVAYIHSSKDAKYIHSPRDTPDKCSPKNLNGCLDICHDTIRTIDSSKHFLKKVG